MRGRALLWVLLVGCDAPEAPAPPAPAAPGSALGSAPGSALGSALGSAPGSAPAQAGGLDEAGRRARFEQRAVIEPPSPLPAPWKRLASDLGGRLLEGAAAWNTRVDGSILVTEITLSFRMFGQDTEVEARLLEALKSRGFTGATLPEVPVEQDGARWSVQVARLKGAAPRETHFDVSWQREAPRADNAAPCKKPTALALPPEAPAWLDAVTNTRSTRRRVAARLDLATESKAVEISMLFQNGYAQDEGVGHYTALAQQRGFKHAEGSGLKQTWQHPDGAELAWKPTRRALGLGCEEAGPVLEISWRNK